MIPILGTSSNFRIENRLLNFCVGETVGEKSPEVSRVFSKDSLLNLEYFDTNLKGAADCGKKFWIKNRPKNENYGGWNCVGWCEIK